MDPGNYRAPRVCCPGRRNPKKLDGSPKQLGGNDPVNTLRNLIDKETKGIERSKTHLRKSSPEQSSHLRTYKDIVNSQKSRYSKDASPGSLDAEMDPDLAAAMMMSESRGQPLRHTPPNAIYTRLFPEDTTKPKVRIVAASKRARGEVLPAGLHQEENLLEDFDGGIVDYFDFNKINAKRHQGALPEPISHEAEGSVENILGISDEADRYKFIVSGNPVKFGNLIQLRGSQVPSWFPGYVMVDPISGRTVSVGEPNQVLEDAWAAMKPTQVASPYGNIILGKPENK